MLQKMKYILKCILSMDYQSLFRTVSDVHCICHKNRIYLFFDIIKCGFQYGAGYKDYLLCEFYNLSSAQRSTYITRGINNTITKKLNNPQYYHFFDYKNEFYEMFGEYLRRDWLLFSKCSLENFCDFMQNHTQIIVKPLNECCGRGVIKLDKADFTSVDELYMYLTNIQAGLVEAVIQQHTDMQRMHSGSVNTIRVGTLFYHSTPHIAYAFMRIGNSNKPVDNLNAGGMCAPIDLETGKINRPGYDKERRIYTIHPRSGCEIVGFQIPYWEQVKKLCLEASCKIPQMGYIGWDVAITEDGPILVEGNNLPGHDILQMPPHLPKDKTGMLPRFREIIPDL